MPAFEKLKAAAKPKTGFGAFIFSMIFEKTTRQKRNRRRSVLDENFTETFAGGRKFARIISRKISGEGSLKKIQ